MCVGGNGEAAAGHLDNSLSLYLVKKKMWGDGPDLGHERHMIKIELMIQTSVCGRKSMRGDGQATHPGNAAEIRYGVCLWKQEELGYS